MMFYFLPQYQLQRKFYKEDIDRHKVIWEVHYDKSLRPIFRTLPDSLSSKKNKENLVSCRKMLYNLMELPDFCIHLFSFKY